jgi:hypothetical protein
MNLDNMQKDYPKSHKPINNCMCDACRLGTEEMERRYKEMLATSGWFTQYVQDDCDCPNHMNIHTHGVQESFSHPDFQICINLSPQVAHEILSLLVYRVKNGERFYVNTDYNDIGEGFTTRFIFAGEGGRVVLRLCVPNKENKFEGAEYEAQFKMVGYGK